MSEELHEPTIRACVDAIRALPVCIGFGCNQTQIADAVEAQMMAEVDPAFAILKQWVDVERQDGSLVSSPAPLCGYMGEYSLLKWLISTGRIKG